MKFLILKTIINKIDNIGGFELINNKRFIKPSIHWFNAVRNSSLKEYHNARTSAIPPIRGADFYIKKYKKKLDSYCILCVYLRNK